VFSYLSGQYKGPLDQAGGAVVLEVNGVGYEVLVPPIVEREIQSTCTVDQPLLLYVSAQAGRDQPWPVLFGFLRPEERSFWELLKSVPRIGGKGAARAMVVPVPEVARAIHEGNKGFLDALPGVTLEGAEKIMASLRKKVGPFLEAESPIARSALGGRANELRQDTVDLLVVMGVKRPDAQRGIDQLLSSRPDLVGVQDLITEYFRAQHSTGPGSA
jgi:Holliday junction DNA helicase RuvA